MLDLTILHVEMSMLVMLSGLLRAVFI